MFINDNHFDVFGTDSHDEDGSAEDFLDALIETTLSIPGLAVAADEMVHFVTLTDEELAQIDADIDAGVYDGFDSDEDKAEWFAAEFYSDSRAYAEAEQDYYDALDY